MHRQEAPETSFSPLEAFSDTLSRYAQLIGHTDPLSPSEAATLIAKHSGTSSLPEKTTVSNNMKHLLHVLHEEDAQIPPDVVMFALDREMDKAEMRSRFGWKEVTLPQAARVLAVLGEPVDPGPASQMEARLKAAYPTISQLFRRKANNTEPSIPARFFLELFATILPDEQERALVEAGIRKYGFSPTEYACLYLTARGKTNEEITEILEFKWQNVKNHEHNLLEKIWETGNTAVYDRTQLSQVAVQEGLVPYSLLVNLPEAGKTGNLGLLSPREAEVLQFITIGLANKQIAQQLVISSQTVKNHVTAILNNSNAKTAPRHRSSGSSPYVPGNRNLGKTMENPSLSGFGEAPQPQSPLFVQPSEDRSWS